MAPEEFWPLAGASETGCQLVTMVKAEAGLSPSTRHFRASVQLGPHRERSPCLSPVGPCDPEEAGLPARASQCAFGKAPSVGPTAPLPALAPGDPSPHALCVTEAAAARPVSGPDSDGWAGGSGLLAVGGEPESLWPQEQDAAPGLEKGVPESSRAGGFSEASGVSVVFLQVAPSL